MQKIRFTVQSRVCETLLIPLYARAREYYQKPPLLVDKTAAKLIKKIDYNFQKFELAPVSMIGVVLRAAYFDAMVRLFIQRHHNPVVVHLGCGLDTRRQRLGSVTNKAYFYQVDLPEVIVFRQQLLPAKSNESYIAASLTETGWMDSLKNSHADATFIFIIEGVMMYLEPRLNQQLFSDLATRFAGAEIHFDVLSTWLSKHTYLHDSVHFTQANFKFGLDDDRSIEQWHPQLRYQGSVNLLRLDGWQRAGWAYVMGQTWVPSLQSAARVVAYLVQPPN